MFAVQSQDAAGRTTFQRAAWLTTSAIAAVAAAPLAVAMDFGKLDDTAASLAKAPFEPRVDEPPSPLDELGYDAARAIQSRRERMLFADGTAEEKGDARWLVGFHHRTRDFPQRVRVAVIERDVTRPIGDFSGFFDYPADIDPADFPEALGVAGLRVLYADEPGDDPREVFSLLGGSYFRLVGMEHA